MNALIALSLKQRVLVFVVTLAVFAGGVVAFMKLNIEAYPDPVPPLVGIIVQSPGQSAEEMERYMTIPVEIQMAGIPNVTAIRTISLFGLSDIKVQFTYAFTYEQAEQWVINRLSQLPPLPNGAMPQISPDSPIGEIMRYRVVGPPGYSVTDLKTIEDWMLERRFKAVPGVVDVNGWGGKTKTYDVTIDQAKLLSYGLTVPQVIAALNNANVNIGGQTVNFGAQSAVVRGIGLIHAMGDIADTMVAQNSGSPVFVRDVAEVKVGNLPRLGIAGQDDNDDIVQGIVLMRRGAESLPTIKRIEALISQINHSSILPPGVSIERIYDRSDLINVTTHTVLHNMLAGIVLIFLVQWVFLGNLRAACITAATIPFALAFAIMLLLATGESANLLSVGAIDFGLVVDATVILVENVIRRLSQPPSERFVMSTSGPPLPRRRLLARQVRGDRQRGDRGEPGHLLLGRDHHRRVRAAVHHERDRGPHLRPDGAHLRLCHRRGLIATFTVTPALCGLVLRGRENETDTLVVRLLHRIYHPIVGFALANRLLTMGLMLLLLLSAGLAMRSLGLEFLPKLEEGNMWIRATMPTSISLEDSNGYVNRMRTILKSFPEVVTVVSQHWPAG